MTERSTIDVSVTWTGALPMLLAILQDGTDEGRRKAREELHRMAMAADKWNDICRQASSAQAEIRAMAERDPRLEAVARDIRREFGFDEGANPSDR